MGLVFASLAKRKVTIGAQQLPQLITSTAADLASDVRSPTNTRKFIANLPGIMALVAGIAVVDSNAAWQAVRAQAIVQVQARVIATNIPGASAISQVGTFLLQ